MPEVSEFKIWKLWIWENLRKLFIKMFCSIKHNWIITYISGRSDFDVTGEKCQTNKSVVLIYIESYKCIDNTCSLLDTLKIWIMWCHNKPTLNTRLRLKK